MPTTYTDTLQTISYISGVATFYVVRSAAIDGIPTYASLTPSWPLVERLDVVAGDYEIPELEFTVDTETESYWKNVLAGETVEIIIDFTESGVTTRMFHGRLIPGSINLGEYDRYTMQRRGTFRCVSILSRLRDIPTQTVLTACGPDMYSLTTWALNHLGPPYNTWYYTDTVAKVMLMQRFLARIMEQINGTIDDDDIIVDYNMDIQWSPQPGDNFDWPYLSFWCGTTDPDELSAGCFQAEEWPNQFPSCLALLFAICRSLLILPVLTYDFAAARYRLMMLSRGNRGATPLTLGEVINSQLCTNSSRTFITVGVRSLWSGAEAAYGQAGQFMQTKGKLFSVVPPSRLAFERRHMWGALRATPAIETNPIERLFFYTGGTSAVSSLTTRFWNYATGAWDTTDSDLTQKQLCRYYASRFCQSKRQYTRRYMGVGPVGATQDSLHLLSTHDIVDENSVTRHFYAVEIRRDLAEDEVEVMWEEA